MRTDAHAMLAAYALDAVEADEQTDVEEHLAECETCRDDLRSYRDTAAVLAAATAQAPPARMRAHVLDRIRSTPQLPPSTAEELTGVPAGAAALGQPAPVDPGPLGPAPGATLGVAPPLDGSAGEQAAPTRSGASRLLRGPSRALLGLAASVLTVLALGAGAWGLSSAQQLDEVRAQQAVVQDVLSAGDVVSAGGFPQLANGVQGDEVVVLLSRSADAALLLPAGLPAAPEGSTWQAWTVTDGTPASAGVFDVGDGQAVSLAGGVSGVQAVAVSLEPAGGSTAPTTDPVLVVSLA